MPDFDFLKQADEPKTGKPEEATGKQPNSFSPPPAEGAAADFDFMQDFAEEPSAGKPDLIAGDGLDALGQAKQTSDDVTVAFDVAPKAESSADDPLADALTEMEAEAAPAVAFDVLPDMTADTTRALSDDIPDPAPAPVEEMPWSVGAGAAKAADGLDSEPMNTTGEDPVPQNDWFTTSEAPVAAAQALDAPGADEIDISPAPGTDPQLIAAMLGGAAGLSMVAPATQAAEPEPFTPPTIEAEPLPAAPDETDPDFATYDELRKHVRHTSLLGSIEAVLGWDERCMMPAAGMEQRAEQITLLSGIIHERLTDPRVGEWLEKLNGSALAADPHSEAGATIRQIRRQYEKRSKLPKSLVEELAHTAIIGQHTWQEARQANDFGMFAPVLEKMVELKRQQAEALGYAEVPYDALLDEFEQGELTSRLTKILGALRDELVPLVAKVRESGRAPDIGLLERSYPVDLQRSFGKSAAAKIGFDFQRGRLDVTAHPFCTGLGPNDCRITTRYDENFFNGGFFGIMHEAGHGIYDQGLRAEQYGLPLGEAVSMGIHESQSRMWEIMVGRGLPFWKYLYGSARRTFKGALAGVPLGRFYGAINDVRPSLIRVEADEFTYNLHILIRFELEQALISGELKVADLPAAWNEKYKSYLGIDVPTDADGVLQDIHWSAGLFGYFPTYSLGNLYAAQFYEQADKDLGGLDGQFERGEFQYLGQWLKTKIHSHGQRFTASELVERITGEPLSHEPLLRHLRKKYDLLYNPESPSIEDWDVPDAGLLTAADEGPEGGVAMADAGDVGGYGLALEPAFDGMSVGGGTQAVGGTGSTTFRPTTIRKKKGSMLGTVMVLGGIVLGGVFGIALGLWILLWLRGPQGDVLKIIDKVPAWILPEAARPTPAIDPTQPATPAATNSPTSSIPPGGPTPSGPFESNPFATPATEPTPGTTPPGN
jgi:carboxypeptidase Taq